MARKNFLKGVLNVSLISALVVLMMTITFQPLAALCVQPEEMGNWVNADPNTNSITRVQVEFVCQDQILNGQPYPPGPPYYVRIFGKCIPADCNWGRVGANRIGTDQIYAYYNQGFAKRYVYVKMSQYRPGQLWVYIWTDFTDPNRADYGVHNWFKRQ